MKFVGYLQHHFSCASVATSEFIHVYNIISKMYICKI